MRNFRPISTRCWQMYLTLMGFSYKRTKGSHDQWGKGEYRTIPVRGNEKQVPPLHLKTGCSTIGVTMQELYKWADENC